MPRTKRPPAAKPAVEPHVYGPPVVVEVMVRVQALAFREADGRYSVVVPEIPGCTTQGDDIEDVKAMVRDAADALLTEIHDQERDQAVRELVEPLPGERRP